MKQYSSYNQDAAISREEALHEEFGSMAEAQNEDAIQVQTRYFEGDHETVQEIDHNLYLREQD